jgi:hypothetical protein
LVALWRYPNGEQICANRTEQKRAKARYGWVALWPGGLLQHSVLVTPNIFLIAEELIALLSFKSKT